MLLGLVAGSAQSAQGMSLLVFPLAFVSSAYIPVGTMPGWMQAFARNQPVTFMVDSVRSLTGGHAAQAIAGHRTAYDVTGSLLWCAVLIVTFAPLAVARFRRG